MRLIDADALCKDVCGIRCGCEPDECGYEDDYGKYCEIAQFIEHAPTIEAVPLKPLAKWMAKYAYCFGLSIYTDPKITEEKRHTTLAEMWEEVFRGMKWEGTDD